MGYDLLVADTVNHALRGVRLADGAVRTVAGTGAQWMQGGPSSGPATAVALSSPWDLAWYDGGVVVAMAGVHRLDGSTRWRRRWRRTPVRPTRGWSTGPRAGVVRPDQRAGQQRGRTTLWLVDAETSALRRVRHGVVHTEVGTGLFDFGHVDGPAGTALLQHPLGVCELPDGSVAVADTYNGAVRRFDPTTAEVTTVASGLAEPSDCWWCGDDGDSAGGGVGGAPGHPGPPAGGRAAGDGRHVPHPAPAHGRWPPEPWSCRWSSCLRPGRSSTIVTARRPTCVVSSTPPELLGSGGGAGSELHRTLRLRAPATDGPSDAVLHVSVRAASCDDDAPGAAEFPACHVHQQDWGVPVRPTPDGGTRLTLVLAGPVGDAVR